MDYNTQQFLLTNFFSNTNWEVTKLANYNFVVLSIKTGFQAKFLLTGISHESKSSDYISEKILIYQTY